MQRFSLHILFLGLLLLSLPNCADLLDIEPAQSIDENEALTTDSRVKAALIGAYDAMSPNSGYLFGGETMFYSELLGDNGEILWVGTFGYPREIFNKDMIKDNLGAQENWLNAYNAINLANNVISAIPTVVEADRGKVEGEARFIRALCYFELVRFYGLPYEAGQANNTPAVPLVLSPTRGISDKDKVARNTVAEVYALVLDDLKKAEGLLPAKNAWRASKGAAAALLARVYLQQGDYANARDAANRVIASGNYELLADYADVFNRDENSAEDIFAAQVTDQDGDNAMNTFFSIPDFGGRDGDVEILEDHLNLYDPDDQRLALFYEGNGAIRSGKWDNQFGNLPIIRLAEMYLIRAEANLRLGASVGAVPAEDYNAVHTRAGLPAKTSVTIADVLLERRLELAQEGFKIHDIKRLKQNVGTLPYNDPKLVFPVPLREIEANPNLTQNPGY